MQLINLTPHAITVILDGTTVTLPISGIIARCLVQREITGYLTHGEDSTLEIPLYETQFGELIGLPEPTTGTFYIVSNITAAAAHRQGRDDVLVPDPIIRDAKGQPIGCTGFTRPAF